MAHRGVGIIRLRKMDNLKSPINQERLKGAIKAVIENLEAVERDDQILNPVNEIYLTVTMHKRISHGLLSTFYLPHPLFNNSTQICIFTKDISKKDPEKTVEIYERRFKSLRLSIKFIPFETLKRDYKTKESKRFLAQSYSIFIVEERLSKFITSYLGDHFFTTPAAKRLRILDFDKGGKLFNMFNLILKSTIWNRAGTERCTKIFVAPSSFSLDRIADNLDACIKGVSLTVMRGWENVRYLHVTSRKTLRFPIYANENVTKELEFPDAREAIRQYMRKQKEMKGATLYTMTDREIHEMLSERLNKLKPDAAPVKKKRLKLDPSLEEDEALQNEKESSINQEEVSENEEEISENEEEVSETEEVLPEDSDELSESDDADSDD